MRQQRIGGQLGLDVAAPTQSRPQTAKARAGCDLQQAEERVRSEIPGTTVRRGGYGA